MQTTHSDDRPEIGLLDVMLARVRAGEDIHVQLPLSGPLGRALLNDIQRLKQVTGLPVRVVFS